MNRSCFAGGRWTMAALAALSLGLSMAVSSARAEATTPTVNPQYQLPARIRGTTMRIDAATPEVIHRVADYGANFISFNLRPDNKRSMEPAPTPENPLAPYEKTLAQLRELLPVCEARGMKAAVVISPWGRHLDYFWQEEKGNHYQDHLPRFWTAFAEAFKDNLTLIAYDVMGEPNFKKGHEATWREDMLPRSIEAIRAVNPNIWLIVEPGPWGMPKGFTTLEPIDDPYVMYCFHLYAPHSYTHQGIRDYPGDQVYPGMLRQFPASPRIMWDRDQLEAFMKPALDFAREHGVRMFCGEWGVIRWAPGRGQWTRDVISIFEEWGFDWCSFSLAGWNGWNPTFPPDAPGAQANYGGIEDSEVLLAWKAGWALNEEEGASDDQ